jgi:hypothetical protein
MTPQESFDNKFEGLNDFFKFIDETFEPVRKHRHDCRINNILIDNDIEPTK